jgi:membrane protein implicated in regulation of membrane protease activity
VIVERLVRSRLFVRSLVVTDVVLAIAALAVGAISLTRPLPAWVWIAFAVCLSVAGALSGAVFLRVTSERDG